MKSDFPISGTPGGHTGGRLPCGSEDVGKTVCLGYQEGPAGFDSRHIDRQPGDGWERKNSLRDLSRHACCRDMGMKPAVISRGYRGNNREPYLVVSDGISEDSDGGPG